MSSRLPVATLALLLGAAAVWWLARDPTLPAGAPDANPGALSSPGASPGAGTAGAGSDAWRPDPARLADDLDARARALARVEYAPAEGAVPERLAALDFDEHRSIRFRQDSALWRSVGSFEVQLFHLGSIQRDPVEIHVVEGGSIRRVPYDPDLFTFDGPAAPLREALEGISVPGFAGFRVHHPLNTPGVMDEVVAFLGASYFRLLGHDHVYGLSSRGIAIDPAVDGPEEFPDFRAFWLERPAPDANSLRFHALLDGPSVTGAFHFELEPGDPTVLDVEARLFARRDVRKLGVAPMSSMFLHAPGRGPAHDDFRPRVHDSDGLLMHTGKDEWIWRPLDNGPGLHVTSLRDEAPRGFGLFQRERRFDRYLDLEALYHRRPSQWVDIVDGDWGTGGVELLEIPSHSEFNDNIAAYWVPDRPFRAGEERRFAYRLVTYGARHPDEQVAAVARTGIGRNALPGQADPPPRDHRRFVVDFTGGTLAALPPEAPVEADLSVLQGSVRGVMVQPLPGSRGKRVTFELIPDGDRPADMRLFLRSGEDVVSETWSYVWYPQRIR